MTTLAKRFLDEHAALFAVGGDGSGDPFQTVRTRSIARLQETGIPAKSEAWKYTRIADVLSDELDLNPPESSDLSHIELPPMTGYVAVCVNGRFESSLSTLPDEPDVTVGGLADLGATDASIGREWLDSLAAEGEEPLVALNGAYAVDGVFIAVQTGVELTTPIHLVHVLSADRPLMVQYRHLIRVGSGSSATVVEHDVVASGAGSTTNSVIEAHVGHLGRLNHFRLQEKTGANHVDSTYVRQHERSQYTTCVVATGDGIVRDNLTVRLAGEHCETNVLGLSLASGSGHIDHHTLIDHAEPNCHSNELFKSILAGKAESVFRGRLLVRKDAQKTAAFQSNRNLLLSEDASANALPQLEIYADDVKCSHGATTGLLDQDALFYLRARGIPRGTARRMLIQAFVDEVVSEIDDEFVRLRIDEILHEFLDRATL